MTVGPTTSTSLAGLIAVDFISDIVLSALAEQTVLLPMVLYAGPEDQANSKVYSFPKIPKTGATGTIAETGEVSETQVDVANLDVNYAEVALAFSLTYSAQELTRIDMMSALGNAAASDMGRYIDTQLAANFSNLNSSQGTNTTDLTVAKVLAALATWEAANGRGDPVLVLHANQLAGLREDYITSSAPGTATQFGGLTRTGEGGNAGSVYGIPVFRDNLCPANSNGYDGALMSTGMNSPIAIKFWRLPLTEIDREIKNRKQVIVVSAAFGTGEVEDGNGVRVIST